MERCQLLQFKVIRYGDSKVFNQTRNLVVDDPKIIRRMKDSLFDIFLNKRFREVNDSGSMFDSKLLRQGLGLKIGKHLFETILAFFPFIMNLAISSRNVNQNMLRILIDFFLKILFIKRVRRLFDILDDYLCLRAFK